MTEFSAESVCVWVKMCWLGNDYQFVPVFLSARPLARKIIPSLCVI